MLRLVCLLALAAAARAHPDVAGPVQVNYYNLNNTVDAPTTEAATTEAPAPVHRRFPHAVLFGGTCGGTIIGERWVITAAHCTLFTGGRSVLAGTSNSDSGAGFSVRVKNLYIHPKFSVGPYWVNAKKFHLKQVAARWDFMLVELQAPLPLDGVNMAAAALDPAPVADDAPVGYAGYGAEHHGGLMRPDMHERALRTVSSERCAKLVQYEPQDMLCAEGRTETRDSACNGDSGSGLVTDDGSPGRRLVGIASWVEDDATVCRPGALVVFSRVSAARSWITEVTGI